MAIAWTRIAVKLHNDGRSLFEEGRPREAAERYREALRALPARERPALDALIHFGLAEALATMGDLAGARRSASRALRLNVKLGNAEGEDACHRLGAWLRAPRGRGAPLPPDETRLLLDHGVRSAQRRLRDAGRPARLRIALWAKLPLAALRRGDAPDPRSGMRFDGRRLSLLSPRAWRAAAMLPVVHVVIARGRAGAGRLDLAEDFGGRDLLARRLRLKLVPGGWRVTREQLLPV